VFLLNLSYNKAITKGRIKMIIDTHVHIFPDQLCPQTIQKMAVIDPEHVLPYYSDGSLADSIKHMKDWGVDLGVMVPIATNAKQQHAVNQFAAKVQATTPYFKSFGSFYPKAGDYEAVLDEVVDLGLHGIKLHPEYQHFMPDDPALFPMYEAIARRKLPIIIHTGYDPASPQFIRATPQRMRTVAEQNKELTIILAHTGGLFFEEDDNIYLGLENVYFDTAIASYCYTPEKYRTLIDLYGADKFLFATDNPWGNALKDQAFFKDVGLTDEEWEKISHKNAQKLFDF